MALEAAEALDHFALARADIQRYLRTNHEEDAQRAIHEIELGADKLNVLHNEVNHPTRKQCLQEAEQAYRFYGKELDESIEIVHELEGIVSEHLETLGPKIVKEGGTLVGHIHEREEQIRHDSEKAAVTTMTNAIIMSTVAVLFAIVVGVLLVKSITRSVRQILTVLRAIAKGDLTQPKLNISTDDELGYWPVPPTAWASRCHLSLVR